MNSTATTKPRTVRRVAARALAQQFRGDADPQPQDNRGVCEDCYFLCPTVTPLSYAPGYQQLDETDRRLYNQLTALMGIEVIGWFEATFLPVLDLSRNRLLATKVDGDLAEALEHFASDERTHIGWWQALHAESLAAVGLEPKTRIVKINPLGSWMFDRLARSSRWVSAAFWIMLALEEHSLEIARRTLGVEAKRIDPRHRDAHRSHQHDEARHVQMDWHLIDRFYGSQSTAVRHANANLFAWILKRYLLPPVRSACQVIDTLAAIRPDVRPLADELKRQLREVSYHPDYRAMMYSPRATPVLFTLFENYPEMAKLAKQLNESTNTGTEPVAEC